MARPVAVLDANVLYSARLRDLFVRLAIAGHYQARWTERILDECFDSLLADRPDLPADHLHRTRRLLHVSLEDLERGLVSPPTADDVSITADGRRLDSKEAVLAWWAVVSTEIEAEEADRNVTPGA